MRHTSQRESEAKYTMTAKNAPAKKRAAKRRAASATGPRAAGMQSESAAADSATPDGSIIITVGGKRYDASELTFNELAELEDYVGLPMDLMQWGSIKTIGFVAYLMERRKDTGIGTIAQYMEGMTVRTLTQPADPTPAGE